MARSSCVSPHYPRLTTPPPLLSIVTHRVYDCYSKSSISAYFENIKESFVKELRSLQDALQKMEDKVVLPPPGHELLYNKIYTLRQSILFLIASYPEFTQSLSIMADALVNEEGIGISEFIFQLLFSNKANFMNDYFPMKTLIFKIFGMDGFCRTMEIEYFQSHDPMSRVCFPIVMRSVPYLRVLRVHIRMDNNMLIAIKNNCSYLNSLTILGGLSNISSIQLVFIFFNIKNLTDYDNIYKLIQPRGAAIVSFPRLQHVFLGEYSTKHVTFYRILLHYYYNRLGFVQRMDPFWDGKILQFTWLDVVLTGCNLMSTTKIKNFALSIRDVLNWKFRSMFGIVRQFESVQITIEPLDVNQEEYIVAGAIWISSLLSTCLTGNRPELIIKTLVEFPLKSLQSMLYCGLALAGPRIARLAFKDSGGFLNIPFYTNVIKACPNIEELIIVGRPYYANFLNEKIDLKELPKLKLLSFCCQKSTRSKIDCVATFLEKILHMAPNINTLHYTFENNIMQTIFKNFMHPPVHVHKKYQKIHSMSPKIPEFGQNIHTVYAMLARDRPLDLQEFRCIVTFFPNLRELITDHKIYKKLRDDLLYLTRGSCTLIRSPFLDEFEEIIFY